MKSAHFPLVLLVDSAKNLPANAGNARDVGGEDSLEKAMATHSNIIAWKIPWTEDPGRLQSTVSQRAGHN